MTDAAPRISVRQDGGIGLGIAKVLSLRDREGSGNSGEGSQREEIVDSTPLERENAPAAGKKNRFFGYPPPKIRFLSEKPEEAPRECLRAFRSVQFVPQFGVWHIAQMCPPADYWPDSGKVADVSTNKLSASLLPVLSSTGMFNFTDFRLRGNVGGHIRHLIVIHSSAEPQRLKKSMITAGSIVVAVRIRACTPNLKGDKPSIGTLYPDSSVLGRHPPSNLGHPFGLRTTTNCLEITHLAEHTLESGSTGSHNFKNSKQAQGHTPDSALDHLLPGGCVCASGGCIRPPFM
ncbi:hypothetical protein B0H14DRAFT_2579720 [Mycena olivaceomarginata]|nr:hypothetical protein B0H14DRAFT_2579720 [Mycena olivaceomarginata]